MERETVLEAGVSIVAVAVFVVALVAIGLTFPRADLAGTGAFAIVGAIVFFVLLMAGAGYWISRW